ncbi:hypothetical protein EII34_13270 [Arachnia propionica]|uniref:Uncharacterized protein n=1 Tax=Arachnia propionica TaxID=1750 RepID=A0A3P1T2Q9_9ACTN|nr:hypothetical protein [Arachnia propionica]RRD03558.1 hypothetical protein EII34_13270 [Arachnia propionica]
MTPWPPERYRQLASSGTSDELMATIEALGPEERRAASAGLDTAIPALADSLREGTWLSPLLVVLLLDGSPRQFLRILARGGHWLAWEVRHHPEQLAVLARVAVSRGATWGAGCVADSGRRHDSHHVVLLDELIVAHDLALPVRSSFWRAWLGTRELAVPRPQRRWQEHYLTACRHPEAFSQLPQEPSLASIIAEALAALHAVEPVDHSRLEAATDEVLSMVRRRDARQFALTWRKALTTWRSRPFGPGRSD